MSEKRDGNIVQPPIDITTRKPVEKKEISPVDFEGLRLYKDALVEHFNEASVRLQQLSSRAKVPDIGPEGFARLYEQWRSILNELRVGTDRMKKDERERRKARLAGVEPDRELAMMVSLVRFGELVRTQLKKVAKNPEWSQDAERLRNIQYLILEGDAKLHEPLDKEGLAWAGLNFWFQKFMRELI